MGMDFDKLASVVAWLTGPEGLSPQDMLTAFAAECMEMEFEDARAYVGEVKASAARVRAAIKAEAERCECAECAAERFNAERSREVSSVQSAMAMAIRAGAFSRKGEA
jgi:RNase P subunit RPR2